MLSSRGRDTRPWAHESRRIPESRPSPTQCSETRGLPGLLSRWQLGSLPCLVPATCSSRSVSGPMAEASLLVRVSPGRGVEAEAGTGVVLERHWERRKAHPTPAPQRQEEIHNKPSMTLKSKLDYGVASWLSGGRSHPPSLFITSLCRNSTFCEQGGGCVGSERTPR